MSSSTINCFRKSGALLEETAAEDDYDDHYDDDDGGDGEVVFGNELAILVGADFDTLF